MIQTLCGDLANGRLARLPFLGYSLLLLALAILVAVGGGFAIGAAERLVGGDLASAQAYRREHFGTLGVALWAIIALTLIFANANLITKRLPDIGLPGWWGVLAITVIAGGIAAVVPQEAAGAFISLVFLALLLILSGLIGSGRHRGL